MFDVIIIGAGPAGMTAAIYAARREMKTLIISKTIGGQVMWASEIENYPGIKSIDSFSFINNMKEHVSSVGVQIVEGEVRKITKIDNGFKIDTETEQYEAKTVIMCLGLLPRRLAIKGELEFNGKGVTYCANCDGPFYRGKTVAVVGGGNSALDAAEVLSKIAKKVYLIHRNENFKAFDSLVSAVKRIENIELVLNAQISEIKGSQRVESIDVDIAGGEKRSIELDGVFIEIGRVAHTDLAAEFVERNERMEIVVDEYCRTKTEGLFAAGDVTQIPFKQISSANGQATVAALAAYQYLQQKEGKEASIIFDRSTHKYTTSPK